ncbi:glycosyltransferase family 4 protein [Bifidobacterium leontopitheci]|uniref:Glycosyl transferase family 1 n=1 Tax=Bifidobacterium leontopitheci TaxID=2650774 RepID=A0A6I1GFX6_9BIFI|nr:glycosyltransferase family 4 protein [Bifidobacterium leontopitheci]KAB7789602.1 glycosyl transferase family 1 [Bifidobacterium leontopitheci]
MTHIAFFSGDITRSGGTENVSIMIANALVDSFDRDTTTSERPAISFISLFEENPEPFFTIDDGISRYTVYPEPTHGIQHYFDTVSRLRKLIEEHHVDTIIDIDGILDMYTLPLKRKTGVKVISWEHFNYHQNPGVPYRKLTRRWAAHKADAIVTLTDADKQLYERHLHPRCPVIAIPNPMQTPHPELQYDAEAELIISSGRLTYQKGFDMLVDVAAKVLPQHPGWQWLILGDGEDSLTLMEKIVDARIDNQLILMGRVPDMSYYYRRASMFVLTSRFEGLPMVLLEAKAYKLPIVSFDCETGPAEIIENGINGDLTATGDIDATADRINALIDSPSKREAYSAHALDNAGKFSKDVILAQWRELLYK